MGLTIYYELSVPRAPGMRQLRAWCEQTAARARQLGCADIGKVETVGPDFIWGQRFLTAPGAWGPETPYWEVPPKRGLMVEVWPGEGCESAHFGLCEYPSRLRRRGRNWAVNFSRWSFRGACKTQYAAEHGWEHFLACHRQIIALLRCWRAFDTGVQVNDEGGYWRTRSQTRLRETLTTYDELMAACAGRMKDAADEVPGLAADSPIFARNDFERLEHRGQALFATQSAAPRFDSNS